MEKISVEWGVSIDSGWEEFTLEELNVQSMEEWNNLSHEEQSERLQTAVDELPERVCLIVNDNSWL